DFVDRAIFDSYPGHETRVRRQNFGLRLLNVSRAFRECCRLLKLAIARATSPDDFESRNFRQLRSQTSGSYTSSSQNCANQRLASRVESVAKKMCRRCPGFQ